MESLLIEWGFEKYLDKFIEHEVDLEALSLLDDEQIRVLIPAIGPQAKFKRALLKWNASKLNSDVTECSKIYDNLENLVEVYGENIGGLTNSPRSSALSSPSTSSSCKSMSLDSLTTLLEKTPDGLQLLKERQQPLGEHNRKVLVREIATHTLRANPKAPVTAETYITWIKEISCLTCVQVLNIMVLLGFMLNYALRVNLTIAIVEMIYDDNDNITAAMNITHGPHNVTEHPGHIEQTRYHWDTKQKNHLLGCFFWGYVLTELPGGRLAEVIGARRVFGYSTLLASILTLLTPGSAAIGFGWIVAVRVLLGFLLGATWPAILPMASKWVPPMDRSKFMSNMMASSLGAAMTMPICGFLIAHFGWESAFYFTGIIGVMWSVAWFAVVYDTPGQHPRISETERNFLMKALPQDNNSKGHMPVPWRKMLLSPPVWAIIITHGASVFGYFTVVNQLPSYIESILHFNIKHNGLLSSLPYLGKYLCALASSVLADSLRRSGKLSTTAARKLFTGFAVGLPGLLMIAQAYMGGDRVWSIAIFTSALTINGAVTAGYLGNGLDIAPNFSGTIFGLANTLSSFGGWLSTFMVGELTKETNTPEQWKIVFYILAGTYITGAFCFVTFGSGDLQPWNNAKPTAEVEKQHEEQPLNEEKA